MEPTVETTEFTVTTNAGAEDVRAIPFARLNDLARQWNGQVQRLTEEMDQLDAEINSASVPADRDKMSHDLGNLNADLQALQQDLPRVEAEIDRRMQPGATII